jgi:hypothetical protein
LIWKKRDHKIMLSMVNLRTLLKKKLETLDRREILSKEEKPFPMVWWQFTQPTTISLITEFKSTTSLSINTTKIMV